MIIPELGGWETNEQGLPLKQVHDSVNLGGQFCLHLAKAGLTGELHCYTMFYFVLFFKHGCYISNLGPHAYIASTLPTEPSPHPQHTLIYNYTVVCFNRQPTSLCRMESQAGPSVLPQHKHCYPEPQGWAAPQEKHCTFKRFACLFVCLSDSGSGPTLVQLGEGGDDMFPYLEFS